MLKFLRLQDFRLFPSLEFRPAPGANFVTGPNASGKTSVLEAICLLARLQSPRTNSLAKCLRHDRPGFRITGEIAGRGLELVFDDGGRRLFLDSLPQSRAADYLETARITWFSNDDLDLVRGPGAARRRFLDFLGSQLLPGYPQTLRTYDRSLRARNLLLREGRPARETAAYSEILAKAGDALHSFRASLLPSLANLLSEAGGDIAGNHERLSISYKPGHSPPLAQALERSRAEESRQRITLVGPHRDDLELLVNARPAADFASEGQQRTFALALKLAQSRQLELAAGRPPLLLLDDVFGELDPVRRNRLLDSLSKNAQKIITATFLDWKTPSPDDAVFRLVGGAWDTRS